MKTSKLFHFFTTLIFLFFSFSSYAQSTKFIFEYSPNFSNYTSYSDIDPSAKLSHNVSIKLDFPITNSTSLSTGIGYYNIGFKYSRETTGITTTGDFFPIQATDIFNYNYFILNAGSRFRYKKYFISPEFGLGILMESSTKFIVENRDGKKTINQSRDKPDKIEFAMVPFSLSIGREISIYNRSIIVGLKGYYAFLKNNKFQDEQINAFGIGLLLGIQID